ncbi:XdhC family protein [Robertkochia solimangrovi]|uniref:XdhC family protein n=1 Tax=Robertkochia solimangrovi TaxID=2213046 RepID=UPI00117DF1B7|nr:XdhC/CoxI family protein [Robertkochia solimangrovi]TRZ42227.1 XdhC/CoxI family protein [Robertkochia solimangrovi]
MNELKSIISQYQALKEQDIPCVLATVVHVNGSSYRGAGARMLVDSYGNITGAISGGCLEGDALRKALLVLTNKENKLVKYDTSDENDAVIGAQLGCNGIIQVLFEPLEFSNRYNTCEMLAQLLNKELPAAIVTGFDLDRFQKQAGTQLILLEDQTVIAKKDPEEGLLMKCREVLESGSSIFGELGMAMKMRNVFIEYFKPPIQLVLIGAGNDALILSKQAELLGWKVIVADGRPSHANKERFAGSCQVVVSKPEEALKDFRIDCRTVFVLMSHNYNYDLAVLKLLLAYPEIPYIGILGPFKKYDRMIDDLEIEGIRIPEDKFSTIYAPVGLEIGAESPAEIGLSVLAEIQSVISGKSARPLREKKTPIHEKEGWEFQKLKI